MSTPETTPYDPENDTPQWVDDLYEEKRELGFRPRRVFISPEYSNHPTVDEAAYAAEFSSFLVRAAKERGSDYVSFVPLPSCLDVIDEDYSRWEHILEMERLLPAERWHIDNIILSEGPKSVGEAVVPQE